MFHLLYACRSSSCKPCISGPDTTEEINSEAAIIDGIASGLPSTLPLPLGFRTDLTTSPAMPAAARVAFVLALGLPSAKAKLAALVAVDPVDSMGVGRQTPPPVLMYRNQSWRPA
jgi:chlorophyllase